MERKKKYGRMYALYVKNTENVSYVEFLEDMLSQKRKILNDIRIKLSNMVDDSWDDTDWIAADYE